jgi:hypothetical protein
LRVGGPLRLTPPDGARDKGRTRHSPPPANAPGRLDGAIAAARREAVSVATAHLVAGDRPAARDAAVRARALAEGEGDVTGRAEADRLLGMIAAVDGAQADDGPTSGRSGSAER